MAEKRKILIANDDGISSEGIARLAAAAGKFGDVWVAAPERQCSGMSVRLTIFDCEMAVREVDFPVPVRGAWSVDGTPADCVKVALLTLLPCRPDLVLSGINDGMNAVTDAYLEPVLAELLEKPLRDGCFWNVNFPTCPLAQCRGVLYGRVPEKHSYYENRYHCVREEPRVRYLTPRATVLRAEQTCEGSDIHAVLNGYVSVGQVRCASF